MINMVECPLKLSSCLVTRSKMKHGVHQLELQFGVQKNQERKNESSLFAITTIRVVSGKQVGEGARREVICGLQGERRDDGGVRGCGDGAGDRSDADWWTGQ